MSRLGFPDLPDEHQAPSWNRKVMAALRRAYPLVASGNLEAAAACVRPFLGATMADFQRVRVLYILSLDAASRVPFQIAFDLIEEALDLAVKVGDLDACCTLACHGASVLHDMQCFGEAAEYYDISLDALRSQGDRDPLRSAPREFDLILSLAIEAFYRADFDKAEDYLSTANRLPLVTADHRLRAARAEWTSALLARWRGDLPYALQRALDAHDVYAIYGTPIERARMRLALADVYLDFAIPPGAVAHSAERGRILALAERPLMDALASTRVIGDCAGEGLALLTYTRYLRAAGRDEDALATITAVETLAGQLADLPLLGQAYTARGTELMARGDAHEALVSYHTAIEVLRKSGVLAQAIWPQRALLVGEEMR